MSEGLGLVVDHTHLPTLERLEPTPPSYAISSDEYKSLPEEWHSEIPARSQAFFSACVGGGLSGCFEHSNFVETGEFIRRSMWQAYISSQKMCGMLGRDNGATLQGALKAANEIGVCRNDLCPMPQSYTTSIPREAYEDAAKHKHSEVTWDARPWAKACDWVTDKKPLLIGGLWTDRHASLNKNNPIEAPSIYSGSSRGYHCRHLCGWIFINGKLYLKARNTHGSDFGINGISYIGEDTWEVLNRDSFFVCLAFGDTEEIEPKRKSYKESTPGDAC